MERRTFMALVSGGLLATPLVADAQQARKVYRIGVLSTAGPEQESFVRSALRGQLRERGWVEGQNLVLEWRYAEAKYERLPDLAAELVRLEPDLIMARGGPGATAAKRATATIPIVMYGATDPVGIGLVQSLARPGGNVTGLSDDQDPEILGKQLQLLKDVAPAVSKVAFLTRVPPSAVVPLISRYEAAGSLLTQGARRGGRLDARARLLLQVLLATTQQRRSVCCTRRRCHSPLGRSMTCRAAARVVFHSQIGCARSDGDRQGDGFHPSHRSRPHRLPVRRSVILRARSSSTASATRPWWVRQLRSRLRRLRC